jgi:twinkle protein
MLTVTGIPGSGKSKFVDQIIDRLAALYGDKAAFCSPEKSPAKLHAATLVSLFVGKSFFTKNSDFKVTIPEYQKAKDFIREHYFFFNFLEVDQTVEGIVEKAIELVKKYGIRRLVIDPWNYLEHNRPQWMSETEYVSLALGQLLIFAKNYEVQVIIVVHPTKIPKDKGTKKYDIPTLYQCSGSANFFNKTDDGLCVYRDFVTNEVTIYIQKIRWDFVGELGQVAFQFDKFSGRYAEVGSEFVSDLKLYERRLNHEEMWPEKPKKAVNQDFHQSKLYYLSSDDRRDLESEEEDPF